MDLVVDTSAVICVLVNEPQMQAVISATSGFDLVAPASLDWEVGNAMSAMFKRKQLTLVQAELALEEFALMNVARRSPSLRRSVQISSSFNIYAYDAYMIALAEQLNCPILALDEGLKRVARQAQISIVEVP